MTKLDAMFRRIGASVLRRSDHSNHDELSKKREIASSAMHENIFIDAIHDRIDGERPNGTSRGALKKLSRFVGTALKPIDRKRIDNTHATHLPLIARLSRNKFEITLSNGQKAPSRTRKQVKLHVLLQSELNRVGSIDRSSGDNVYTITGAEQKFGNDVPQQGEVTTVSHAADGPRNSKSTFVETGTPHADSDLDAGSQITPCLASSEAVAKQTLQVQPDAATGIDTQNRSGKQPTTNVNDTSRGGDEFMFPKVDAGLSRSSTSLVTFESQSLDLDHLDYMFQTGSHNVKELCDDNADDWWRGCWANLIVQNQRDPAALEAILLENLGPEISEAQREDIACIRQMAVAAYEPKIVADGNTRGFHTIMTGMELANRVADLGTSSRLKLPNHQDLDGVEGDSICRRLTHALLAKANVPESQINSCVNEDQPGTTQMIVTLLRQLNADCVVFDRPNGSDGRWDEKATSVTVCTNAGSRLSQLDFDPTKESCTHSLVNECDDLPVLMRQGGKVKLCMPRGLLFPYPT